MRILIVVHGFPPLAEGGSEVYVHAAARELAGRFGDDVLVLTREADSRTREYNVRHETRDGLRIVWINNTFRQTRSFEDSYQNEAIARIAERVIDEFKPDVAHVHHLTCLSTLIVPALTSRGIPVFFTLHDYWLMCHRGQLFDLDYRVCDGSEAGPHVQSCERCIDARGPASIRAVTRAMLGIPKRAPRDAHMREIAAQVTQFLSPSEDLRQRFIAFGIPAEKIVHSSLGFDRKSFVGPAQAGPHVPTRLRLGFVGTLMVSKAPHVLLEAARGVGRGEVTVDLFGAYSPYHGDDSYRGRLTPLLSLEGVRHHGHVPHREMPAAFASFDVLVVPSMWPENSPLVIHEAFLAGKPVIASRIGGIPELVEDGRNGLLFEPGDVEGLRAAVARLLSEPGLLERLRSGITLPRTIEEDVASVRGMYVGPAKAGPHVLETGPRRIAAVVVNYRTPDDTLLAVRSLQASRRALDEIIVVDNDDVGQEGRERQEGQDGREGKSRPVANLLTGRNLGFSGGVNVGIRAALANGADAVLLVNSDVVLPPDCVAKLEGAAFATSRPRIAGPVLRARFAPDVIESVGLSYDPRSGRMRHRGAVDGRRVRLAAFATSGRWATRQSSAGWRFAVRRTALAPMKPDATCETVDAISGCVMLIPRQIFEAIGPFDESYFFSFEDLDFCSRARAAGFGVVVDTRAAAYHEGGRSVHASPNDRLYFAARNHLRLAASTAPDASRVAHLSRLSAIVLLNLAHAGTAKGGSLASRVIAVLRGTKDYAAGRFGPGRSSLKPVREPAARATPRSLR